MRLHLGGAAALAALMAQDSAPRPAARPAVSPRRMKLDGAAKPLPSELRDGPLVLHLVRPDEQRLRG